MSRSIENRRDTMRNIVLAAATAFALIVASAPSFAAPTHADSGTQVQSNNSFYSGSNRQDLIWPGK
jgi:hypothetical protein